LRGNGRGNSSWGVEPLKTLFGEEYVNQQLAESKHNVYTEWRISQGNLDHVKALILFYKINLEKTTPQLSGLKSLIKAWKTLFYVAPTFSH